MCAILGLNLPDKELIEQMNAAASHRGPDDTGIFIDASVALGHNRLAILDLSALGHQPMEAAGLQIVFNGEIYNFKELRAELEAAGEEFRSSTDTEVVLRGYAREGREFFKKLRGMWALALYDAKAGTVVLSRDPFGIKPLYYYEHAGRFAFASELRALLPVLARFGASDNALAHRLYFSLGYMPAPHSPFAEVKKVLPGEVLSYDLAAKALTRTGMVAPYDDAPLALEESLEDTVRAHFVSDVPVGLFYSGGTDSTLLLATARKLGFDPAAFFLRIPNRLDNEYALAAAQELGVTPVIIEFGEQEAFAALMRSLTSLDEPFADSSYIPTEYLSSQVAKTHKVVLSGEGGDEFFGGYHRHGHLLGLRGGVRLVPSALVRLLPARLRRAVESKINRDPYAAYVEFVRVDEGLVSREEAVEFMRARVSGRHDDPGLSLDQEVYLPDDLLFKIDRAGMRYGLEGRVPFLDKRFFASARAIPAKERHGGKGGKAALKNILRRYLPERLVERPKQGFSMPLAMASKIPDAIFAEAVTEAQKYPALVPLPPKLVARLAAAQPVRDEFRRRHPQLTYALLMWGGWRKSFTLKI
jgi:asparagine synthase (glutamine-hydrolysing)